MSNQDRYYVADPLFNPFKIIMEDDPYQEGVQKFLDGWREEHGEAPTRHFGITTLMRSPRQLALNRRHGASMKTDVTTLLPMIRGKLVHEAIEKASAKLPHVLTEQRYGLLIDNGGQDTLVHHAIDYFDTETGVYCDWKNTSSTALQFDKWEWEAEVNFARHLLELHGHEVKEMYIGALVDDWRPSKVGRAGMPEEPIVKLPIKRWTNEQVLRFVTSMVDGHLNAEDEKDEHLPYCTEEEKWNRSGGFKVYGVKKDGSVSSRALTAETFPTEQDARDWAAEEGKPVGKVLKIAGKPIRCLFYCDSQTFCNQFKTQHLDDAKQTS